MLSQRDASVLRRFEAFCALEGLGPPADALAEAAGIEAFLALSCAHLAPHSLGTYRSVLQRLGGTRPLGVTRCPGSAASRPYAGAEVAAIWSMAQSQSSALRIANATVLLSATLGAGLHPGEVARLCGTDVVRRRGITTVEVAGAPARSVRVRPPYDTELAALAKGPGFMFRPGAPIRRAKNLIGEVCAALVHDPDEVALVSGRARATFICAHLADGTPLRQLCRWAGLQDVESLLRYARHVQGAPPSKAALRQAAHRA